MNIFNNISIKTFLTGVIGLLVAVITLLSAINVYNTYQTRKEVLRVSLANETTDYLLTASRFEAIERGVTSMALSSNNQTDPAVITKIMNARTKGDEAYNHALVNLKDLMQRDPNNKLMPSSLARTNDNFTQLQTARKRADANLKKETKDYPPKEWIKTVTGLIEANAQLRISTFTSTANKETLQEALRMNLELKQAVWLVGEYAGRERATVASFVAGKKPIDAQTMDRLNTLRSVVDINIPTILRLKEISGVDPVVFRSIEKMERDYMGIFSDVRKSIFDASLTGAYPLSGQEWIAKSTDAIDSILDVSASVGKMVDDRLKTENNISKVKLISSGFFLCAFVALGIVSIGVIRWKVLDPLEYLSESMTKIEETGSINMRLDVTSRDEGGRMAGAFNSMLDKFHDIISSIHSTVEQLAAASEELSYSANHIAEGSKVQSGRSAQVSTAAQEMTATLIEVTRNISSAADAANDASAVALQGGEMVVKTIDSMNGISTTAKESSRIITILGDRSKEIGKIVNVINDIADQTNLLALNAAIEAARAGEQGRGFAVVADEVRKLAEKTVKATTEIRKMIKAMQSETDKAIVSMNTEVKAVDDGVKLAEEAGSTLKRIVEQVDTVTSMIHQVSTASEEQSAATEQISGDIESVAEIIKATSGSAEEVAKASHEIASLASSLKIIVEKFDISSHKKGVIADSASKYSI